MKLTSITQITVDGAIQANGHATPDELAGGFTRDGWAMGVFADETGDFITATYEHADAFLFGRRTYEMFEESWGTDEQMKRHPIGVALNRARKYVTSNTISDAPWANTTVLSGDVASTLQELKDSPGGEIQVHGSGALIRWLLAHDLLDELTLLIVPVILGQGTRLFPESGVDVALEVLESRTDAKGVTVVTYRPTRRPVYRPNRPT